MGLACGKCEGQRRRYVGLRAQSDVWCYLDTGCLLKCLILSKYAEGRRFGNERLTIDEIHPVLVSGFTSNRSAAALHLPGYRGW